MDHRDVLSAAQNRIISAELRYRRLERKVETALAYLDNIKGPFADPHVLREMLTVHSPD